MKKTILIFLLPWALALPPATATDFRATDHFELGADKTITNELWLRAHTIAVKGTTEDDIFLLADGSVAASTNDQPALSLSGPLRGDVWAAGESIELAGPASRHARLLGFKSVYINSAVAKNLIAVGGTVSMGEAAEVGGSSILIGQDVLAEGTLQGTTHIYGSQVTLSGTFNGDVTITAADINVMPGTHIAGNLSYLMDRDLILDSKVTIGGKMIKLEPKVVAQPSGMSVGTLLLQLGLLFGAILTGMAFISLFPGVVALSVQNLAESFWRCLLIGFATFCLVPMTAFFLIFTVVGLPLSLVMILAYFIVVYLAKIIVGIHVGHLILRRKQGGPVALPLPMLTMGLFVMYLGTSLPFPINILLWFAFVFLGLGSLVSTVLDRRTPVMVAYSSTLGNAPPPLPGDTGPGAG